MRFGSLPVLAIPVCALAVPVIANAQDGQPFVHGCTSLPFQEQHHPIDDDCGIEGKLADSDKKMESRAKNDFCETGTPTLVTFFTFGKLKQTTDASGFVLGADRSGARNVWTTNPGAVTIGEGSLVKLAGFVLRADIANKSGGENVNCKRGGRERNDVHIHLAKTKSKSASNFCTAVVAEISPHLRPDDLNAGDLMLTEGFPVRVRGHLFFDGEHPVRCDMTHPANSRASTWEIHPVYGIDVCKHKSLTTCDPRTESEWTSLADFIAAQESDEHP